MIDFLLHPANSPFTIAIALMLAFTVIEVISASLGMGLSDMVDSILPEVDADVDIDLDLDGVEPGAGTDSLTKMLAWFRIGEVPAIMLFLVFLTGFGLAGWTVQYTTMMVIRTPLPPLIAAVIALMAAIPVVRVCGGVLGKYMPKDETYVVSEKSFHGMIATITLGTAEKDKPAQAKLRDVHGQTHYIMVEPDNPTESYPQGGKTIIVGQNGAIYRVIDATSSAMSD